MDKNTFIQTAIEATKRRDGENAVAHVVRMAEFTQMVAALSLEEEVSRMDILKLKIDSVVIDKQGRRLIVKNVHQDAPMFEIMELPMGETYYIFESSFEHEYKPEVKG